MRTRRGRDDRRAEFLRESLDVRCAGREQGILEPRSFRKRNPEGTPLEELVQPGHEAAGGHGHRPVVRQRQPFVQQQLDVGERHPRVFTLEYAFHQVQA